VWIRDSEYQNQRVNHGSGRHQPEAANAMIQLFKVFGKGGRSILFDEDIVGLDDAGQWPDTLA
jgi:hypothetical protein